MRTTYTGCSDVALVEAISEQGVGHDIAIEAAATIRFFGLDGAPSAGEPAPASGCETVPALRDEG
jgi:hypothetical protein